MSEDPAVEALMEACVAAGMATRRAHAAAIEAREQAAKRKAPLSSDDVEHLNKLEATAERLSRSFVNAQRRLSEANRIRFRERLDEVTHRIAEQLGRSK
jgi:hypothetical protein